MKIKKATISLLFLLGVALISFGLNNQNNISFEEPPNIQPEQNRTETSVLGIEGDEVRVKKVVDGDTIELETGERVRYIGIDTPETVDPRRPVGCFGKEASQVNKQLVEGKKVILVKDISDTDKYDRLLRYVYLPEDGNLLFVNDYLVRQGYALTYTYPPDVKFDQQFKDAEREAREAKRGLWGNCPVK